MRESQYAHKVVKQNQLRAASGREKEIKEERLVLKQEAYFQSFLSIVCVYLVIKATEEQQKLSLSLKHTFRVTYLGTQLGSRAM